MRAALLGRTWLGAALILGLVGCATPLLAMDGFPVKQPMQQQVIGQTNDNSGFDNIELVDADLKGKIAVLRVGSDPNANNLLTIFVGLKNKTAHRLELEVQTIYKDKDGNALNKGSWIPMTLNPHQEKEYRSSSITTDAADFTVRVRLANNSGNPND